MIRQEDKRLDSNIVGMARNSGSRRLICELVLLIRLLDSSQGVVRQSGASNCELLHSDCRHCELLTEYIGRAHLSTDQAIGDFKIHQEIHRTLGIDTVRQVCAVILGENLGQEET